MQGLFSDWQAQGITSVLHEMPGGYANNTKAMYGLADKIEAEGIRIMSGVSVTGFKQDRKGSITSVETEKGEIATDYVLIGAGPWAKQFWDMLEMPKTISIKNPETGIVTDDIPMWVYWSLQEGTLGVDPKLQVTNDG